MCGIALDDRDFAIGLFWKGSRTQTEASPRIRILSMVLHRHLATSSHFGFGIWDFLHFRTSVVFDSMANLG